MNKNKNSAGKKIYIIKADRAAEEKLKANFSDNELEISSMEDLSYVHRLTNIMKKLRSKTGCPWDREQNHETLLPYLLEETYEVAAAIEEKNIDEICEELGDLLLQIVFHCQIGEEEGTFNLEDSARKIVEKLIRRHPHVFSDTKVSGSGEVVKNWEEIKKQEKAGKEEEKSILDGVPSGLPALIEATLLGKKASKVGFDWDKAEDIMVKIKEEVGELEDAIKEKKPSHIREEVGDILFSVVNICRHLSVDPEYALKSTSKKFIRRFKKIEEVLRKKEGIKMMKKMSLEELDKLWDKVKEEEKNEA